MPTKIIIMGAAGKDFHVFNTCYRDRPEFEVVAFTATQIPNIANRRYPPILAGGSYPEGVPILPEKDLQSIIRRERVDQVVFAYSDVSHEHVAGCRRLAEEAGASFRTFDVEATMLPSSRPVVAICAVRTGVGKSPTSRKVSSILRDKGKNVVAVRHPMPYGDLTKQVVQRFENIDDLVAHDCTIEEMEEYEHHIRNGVVVYAGVDYGKILEEASREAEVIIWDGGNNDTPFFRPTVWITLVDPLRAGDEVSYFPGKENFERADVLLINKMDQATPDQIRTVERNISKFNPDATVIRAQSTIHVTDAESIRGKKVLVVEDGPTLTHGNMSYGAGVLAARMNGAAELVDPRATAVGSIADTFANFPHIGPLLPAMGYGPSQMAELQETIERTNCDLVVIGTPIDLRRVVKLDRPSVRVTYELDEIGSPNLQEVLDKL